MCFQLLFLDQILYVFGFATHTLFAYMFRYPSILQSSTVDGGSSVAVLTYLWKILEAIDQTDLVQLILEYLLASAERPQTPKHPQEGRHLTEPLTKTQSIPSAPSFFSVVDLCLASLNSSNSEAVTAALRVVDVIIRKHHRFAFSTLLKTSQSLSDKSRRTIGSITQDVKAYLQMAINMDRGLELDESYERCLKDALAMVECHKCLEKEQAAQNMRQDDPLLKVLQGLLTSFLTNAVETNLCLTSTITNLAACQFTRLEKLLVAEDELDSTHNESKNTDVESTKSVHHTQEDEDSEEERYRRFKRSLEIIKTQKRDEALVFAIVERLMKRLESLSSKLPNVSALISHRRKALQRSLRQEDDTQSSLFAQDTRELSTSSRAGHATPRTLPATPQLSPRKARAPPAPPSRTVTPMSSQNSLRTKSPSPSRRPSLVASALTPLARLFGVQRLSSSPSSASKTLSPRPSLLFLREEARATSLQEDFAPEAQSSPTYVIGFPHGTNQASVRRQSRAGTDQVQSEHHGDGEDASNLTKEASLDLVLTNAVILQEFVMELAAVIHVRASFVDSEIQF